MDGMLDPQDKAYLDTILKHINDSVDQVRESTHSQDQELVKLNFQVSSIETLLQKINASLHEGVNGKDPIITRIALIEDAIARLRLRQNDTEVKTEDAASLALVEGVKGKWHTVATIAPGSLALLAQALSWIFKGHG